MRNIHSKPAGDGQVQDRVHGYGDKSSVLQFSPFVEDVRALTGEGSGLRYPKP